MANYLPAFQCYPTITDGDKYFDFLDDPVGAPAAWTTITIPASTFTGMNSLCSALETLLQVEDATFTVTCGTDGKITIARTTGNFTIGWDTGPHGTDPGSDDDNCADWFGFDNDNNDSGAQSYESDGIHWGGFYGERMVLEDTKDRSQLIGPKTFVSVSGAASRCTFDTHYQRRIRLSHISASNFLGTSNGTFQNWWEIAGAGTAFRYYSSTSPSWVNEGPYRLIEGSDSGLIRAPRLSPAAEYYSIDLNMLEQS